MYPYSAIFTPMTTSPQILVQQYGYSTATFSSSSSIPQTRYADQLHNSGLPYNCMVPSSSDMYRHQHPGWNGFDNVRNVLQPPMAPAPQGFSSEYQTMAQGKCAACFGVYPIYFMDQNLCYECSSYTQINFNKPTADSNNAYWSPLSCESASSCSSIGTSPSTPFTPSPVPNGMQKKCKPPKKTVCTNCKTEESTMWRRGPTGNRLCNPCGLHLKNHKTDRPSHLFTKPIQKRKRNCKAAPSSQGADISTGFVSTNRQSKF
uniref:GATA-type domain-containing protein n=1 Tax=Panagrellus redivivus TaxID=6233 RepID=A0A7E4W2B0_PANRE